MIQFLSRHKNRENSGIYQDLSLVDVKQKYWDAREEFPIQ
jgi:hypothetical protein